MWLTAKCNPPEAGTYVTLGHSGGEQISRFDGEHWGRSGVEFWQLKEPRPIPGEVSPTPYLNTETKQQIAVLGGMQGCLEDLLEKPLRNAIAVKPILKEAGQRIQAALDILFMGTDPEQGKAVMRLVNCSTIRVCPKSTEMDEDWVICNVNDVNLLGTMAVESHECTFCDADRYHVKKCELRKCLLRMGATKKEDTIDCPFKGVL